MAKLIITGANGAATQTVADPNTEGVYAKVKTGRRTEN